MQDGGYNRRQFQLYAAAVLCFLKAFHIVPQDPQRAQQRPPGQAEASLSGELPSQFTAVHQPLNRQPPGRKVRFLLLFIICFYNFNRIAIGKCHGSLGGFSLLPFLRGDMLNIREA